MDEAARELGLADHYLDVGQPQRALDALERTAGRGLAEPMFWELRARALAELDRWPEAGAAAREGLRLDGESVVLLALAAQAAAEQGELGDAEELLLAALRLEPDAPALLSQYAFLLARGGQLAKAGRVLDRAERVDPDDARVIQARIAVAYLAGDEKFAEREAERMLTEVDPEHPAAHAMLGGLRLERGRYLGGRRHLDTAAAYDVTDHGMASVAREGRVLTHWLLWPLWPIQRWGPAKVWLGFLAGFGLLLVLRQEAAAGVWGLAYLFLVVYSWTIGPLARWWLRRRW